MLGEVSGVWDRVRREKRGNGAKVRGRAGGTDAGAFPAARAYRKPRIDPPAQPRPKPNPVPRSPLAGLSGDG